jgi:two-component SAPR family response regulator
MEESIKVLIIDDDAILVFLLEKMIVNHGLDKNPLSFENGQFALDFLMQNVEVGHLYIIFLDINMPVLNGWMFLEELSNFGEPEQFHVYMVSSSTDQSDVKRAMKSNYTRDYLIKPITPNRIETIKKKFS